MDINLEVVLQCEELVLDFNFVGINMGDAFRLYISIQIPCNL